MKALTALNFKHLIKIVGIILLGALEPIINIISSNAERYINIENFNYIFIFNLLIISCGVLFVRIFTKKDTISIAIWVSFLFMVFFMYGAFKEYLYAWEIKRYTAYIFITLILLLAIATFRFLKNTNNQKIITLIMTIWIAIPIVEFLTKHSFAKDGKFGNTQYVQRFQSKPDIYFFLLDAYPTWDMVKEDLGLKDNALLNYLEKNDYLTSQNAFSNYNFTLASLGSIFAGDYIKFEKDKMISFQDFSSAFNWNNPVINKLKANDYLFYMAPSGIWTEIDCNNKIDKCFKGFISGDLIDQLIGMTIFSVLPLKFSKASYLKFETLEKEITFATTKPKFVFVHIPHVHDVLFNKKCQIQAKDTPIIDSKVKAQKVADTIACTNSKMMQLLNLIHQNNPNALIILQSDHGMISDYKQRDPSISNAVYWERNFYKWEPDSYKSFKNGFGIMRAIKLPSNLKSNEQANIAIKSTSPINLFEVIFSILEGKAPILKSNQHFIFRDAGEKNKFFIHEISPAITKLNN